MRLLLIGIVAGLAVGFFEELGWTGFAAPRLGARHGIVTAGLSMGVLWGAWHFPLFSGSAGSSGAIPPALYVAALLFSWLPPYRVLMVWVYDRTESLLVAMLMHVSLTASIRIVTPVGNEGVPLFIYDFVLAAALWVVVAAVQRQQTLPRQVRGVLPVQDGVRVFREKGTGSSHLWRLGLTSLGPVFMGFAEWIEERRREIGGQLLFVSREGVVLRDIVDRLRRARGEESSRHRLVYFEEVRGSSDTHRRHAGGTRIAAVCTQDATHGRALRCHFRLDIRRLGS